MKKMSVLAVNVVTFSRLPLTTYGCVLMYQQNWLASWLFVVGGMLGTDMIDGPLARKLNAQTRLGVKADRFCDVVASWILVGGWLFYAQKYFTWFDWQKVFISFTVILVTGIIISINPTGVRFWSRVNRWFTEDKGDFFFGTIVAGLIILWLACNINLLMVCITVFSGLVAILVNAEKVTDFAKSAFPVFWRN